MAHVAKWKKEEVKELRQLISEYPVVGVVNMAGVPGRQIQRIRASMRGEGRLKMSRKRLMKRALKGAGKEGIEELSSHITGQPGFLFSRSSPFRVYKMLERSKTRAPVKPNAIASSDIAVSKGETPFPPGPILSELQQAGIPAAIEKGKVVIKEDKVIVKAGERVSPEVANALARLEIEPVEVKLDLLAAYEDGVVFTSEELGIDSEKLTAELAQAYQQAFNLAVNAAYPVKESAPALIAQAAVRARNLALHAWIFEKEVMPALVALAHARAACLEALTRAKVKSDE